LSSILLSVKTRLSKFCRITEKQNPVIAECHNCSLTELQNYRIT
jgi:hypothetical protein